MKSPRNIMVCVTQQKTCERLIRRGAELRDAYDGELFVIHVAKEGWNFLGKTKEGDALEYLFQKSKSYGANLTVVRSHDVLETLKDLAEKHDIDLIVLGESQEDSEENNIVSKLGKRLRDDVGFEIVPVKMKRKVV
ncbi:universal stress protein [Geosporobacter ferrireducens]|uniref:Universal stress protein UspA n=1 Tax=Geosporobacter ferrireducens TaxID=1424294 RepID=A0A1D8GMN7_9FIRM|nr:universal stress protein [Geosporobacter ferrireducens]AOT72188.1 universal stress protein UspA [Geosporobacter ferrireducens]MTI56078.1 universal stress protein UspA [Geosporobacter ferrireducens]